MQQVKQESVGDESGLSTYLNSAVKSVTMNSGEASISFYIGNTNREYKLWMTGNRFDFNAAIKARGYGAFAVRKKDDPNSQNRIFTGAQGYSMLSPILNGSFNGPILVTGGGSNNEYHVVWSYAERSGSQIRINGFDVGQNRRVDETNWFGSTSSYQIFNVYGGVLAV